jgi:lysophospholipid acyltransferase (LPLAT)-like uncharacterized protein
MSDPLTSSQRLQTRLIGATVASAISALCRTLTWKIEGAEHYDDILRSGRQPIIAFWHGRILPATWFFRHRGIVALTSANFDGQWIARVIEHLGNRTVAGSSSRGGVRALLQLKREIGAGHPVAFALDGPRGPARVPQPGAVWLAGATGSPILPVHAESSACWEISSWDRTQVPKPFSRVVLVMGPPIEVGGRTAGAEGESGAALLRALAHAESKARAALEDQGRDSLPR